MKIPIEEVPWHLFLANVPNSATDPSVRPLMRVFADPTASTNWGVYNRRSEGHLVVNFFENFRLDFDHTWLRLLLSKLGMEGGPISSAAWSYELEEPKSFALSDVVIGFHDKAGPGLLIAETKRTTERLLNGVSPKDDPSNGYYLQLPSFADVKRKAQLLLVSREASISLNPTLRANPSLILWDEIACMQRRILESAAGGDVDFRRAVRLHHAVLGLRLSDECEATKFEVSPLKATEIAAFVQGVERYVRYAKKGEIVEPDGWLLTEPGRKDLLTREAQNSSDRQFPYWRAGAQIP